MQYTCVKVQRGIPCSIFSKNKTKQNKKTAEDLAPAETAWTYNYLPWITSILLMDLCLFVCLQ